MKRITQFLVLMYIVFFGASAFSQVANYKFEHEIGEFKPIDPNSKNAHEIKQWYWGLTSNGPLGMPNFNNLTDPISFDFNFSLGSMVFDKLKISSSGYVTFSKTAMQPPGYNPWGPGNSQISNSPSNAGAMVAPFWVRSTASGILPNSTIRYELSGESPNRVFTVEWSNFAASINQSSNPQPTDGHLSMQVKLHETTNVIEYIYKRLPATSAISAVAIGLSDPAGFLLPGGFLNLNTDLTKPTVRSDIFVNGITTKPLDNQVFRFTPPSCLYTGISVVSNITSNSAVLNLTKASNVDLEVLISPGVVPDNTTPADYTIPAGQTTLSLPNLVPGTRYQIYFRYKCTDGQVLTWNEYSNFFTPCKAISDVFFQGFENYDNAQTVGYSNAPDCWVNINDTNNGVQSYNHGIGTTARPGGAKGFSSSRNNAVESQRGALMLISPEITDLGSGKKQLKFWARGGILKVYTMDGNTTTANKTLIKTIELKPSEWIEHIVPFPLGITDKYFAFVNDMPVANAFYLDDISYELAPACIPVAANDISLPVVLKNGATVQWHDVYNSPGVTYDVEVRESGLPGTGGEVFSLKKVNAKTAVITGLTPSTTYVVYVKANCTGNSSSTWSSGNVFITMCDYSNWQIAPKPVTYCGPHKAELTAKAFGETVLWYEYKEAEKPVYIGENFTTPFITENKSYFVKNQKLTPGVSAKIGTDETQGYFPFYTYYNAFATKAQYVVDAEKLKKQNLRAGAITSLKLEVAKGGQAPLKDFSISIGQINRNYLVGEYEGAPTYVWNRYFEPNANLTEVYSNTSELFDKAGTKEFVFTVPFDWDGESSLVVQIFWYNGAALGNYGEGKEIEFLYTNWTPSAGMPANAMGGMYAYIKNATEASLVSKQMLKDASGKGGYVIPSSSRVSVSSNSRIPNTTFVGIGACESPFTEVPITITPSPEIKLDKTGVSSCDGTESSLIKLIDAAGYTDFNWEPTDGVQGDKDSGWSFTNPEEREYILVASKVDGCQSIQKVINYKNSKPKATGGLDKITDLCKDGIAELKVMGSPHEAVTFSDNSKISEKKGMSAYVNSARFSRQQYIYKATELFDAGVEGIGYINQISFSTNFHLGVNVNKSYVIRMKLVNESSFLDDKFYEDGFATVYRGSNLTPAIGGGWQDIILDNAFYWDGVSHIVVELIQEGNGGGIDVSTNITEYTGSTRPVDNVGLYNFSDTTRDLYNGTIVKGRLDVRFGFAQPKVNWSPVTNLYLDNKATQPYVAGTDVSTVYVLPNAAGTPIDYNVNITSPNNCVATEVYTVKPIDIGLPKIAAQSFCTAVAVTDLVVDAYPGGELTYYSSATSANKLTEITKTGTYYVELTAAGCKTSRVSFSVNIVDLKHPTVEFTQRICGSGTIADLKAQGVVNSQIKWYATADATTPLPTTQALVDNTTYYVSQSFNNCESEKAAVLVDINDAPRSLGNQTAYICGVTEFGSINLKQDAGSQLVWYASQTSTQPIANTDKAISGIYYVSQKVNACESPRALVEVSVQANVPAPTASIQYKCGGGTVNDLEAEVLSGATAEWYANATATTPLKGETGLTSGTYYVAQRLGSCISARKAVSVRIISNNAPIVDPYSLCEGAKVKDLKITAATGVTYKWYRNNASTTALSPEDVLTSAPYFVSRIENGCESLRAQVQVTINNRPKSPTGVSPQTFADYAELSNIVMDQPNVSWYLTYDDAMNGKNKLPANRPLENGRTYYGVILGVDGCPSMPIAIETFIVLGINDMDLTKLKYYPNPVHDVLTVSYDTPIVKVDVYDLSGKLVIQRSFDNKTISIDLSGLSSGSYMLNIKTAENSQFVKVVKK